MTEAGHRDDPRAAGILTAQLYSWADLQSDRERPPRCSGVYAWFFRVPPDGVPCEGSITRDGFTLLYIGISPGRGVSRETLRTRIRYHFRGNAEGSTLRLSLGCLLESTLATTLRCVGSGKRMTFGSAEDRLTQWMEDNARVCWMETGRPWEAEAELIRTLVLPLNLAQNSHGFCATLRQIREAARQRARVMPVDRAHLQK